MIMEVGIYGRKRHLRGPEFCDNLFVWKPHLALTQGSPMALYLAITSYMVLEIKPRFGQMQGKLPLSTILSIWHQTARFKNTPKGARVINSTVVVCFPCMQST